MKNDAFSSMPIDLNLSAESKCEVSASLICEEVLVVVMSGNFSFFLEPADYLG